MWFFCESKIGLSKYKNTSEALIWLDSPVTMIEGHFSGNVIILLIQNWTDWNLRQINIIQVLFCFCFRCCYPNKLDRWSFNLNYLIFIVPLLVLKRIQLFPIKKWYTACFHLLGKINFWVSSSCFCIHFLQTAFICFYF